MASAKHNDAPAGFNRRVSKKSAAKFMAQLMMPALDAELDDKELARLEQKAAREKKARMKDTFYRAHMAVEAAKALSDYATYHRLATKSDDDALKAKEALAFRAFVEEVARFMRVPVVDMQSLRIKERFRHVGSMEQEFEPCLDADRKRLA